MGAEASTTTRPRSSVVRLGAHTLVYGVAPALAGIVGLVTVPIYTRVFEPVDYGYISTVSAVVTLLAGLSVLGLDSAAARFYYDDDVDRRNSVLSTWFWFQSAVTLGVFLVLALSARWLSDFLSGSPALALPIALAGLALPLGTVRMVASNSLRFANRPVATTVYASVSIVLGAVLGVAAVVGLGWGIEGVFLGQALAAVTVAVIGLRILGERVSPRRASRSLIRPLLLFGLPLVPAIAAEWITASSDRLILNAMVGGSQVGLYSVAAGIAGIMMLLVAAFRMAWAPFVFSQLHLDNYRHFIANTLEWAGWAAFVMAALLALSAETLVATVAGAEYAQAYRAVPPLALSAAFMVLFLVFAIGSNIAKSTRGVAVASGVGALSNIALNVVLIPQMGFVGAAVGTLFAWALATVVMYVASQKVCPLPYRLWKLMIVVVSASGVAALPCFPAVELPLWLGLVLVTCLMSLPLLLRMDSPFTVRSAGTPTELGD